MLGSTVAPSRLDIAKSAIIATPPPASDGPAETQMTTKPSLIQRDAIAAISARMAIAFALGVAPVACLAEKFVPFGGQPDGSEIFVQEAPATVRKDGKLQGWFRTVPKGKATVTDEFGFERPYRDMLALNVADCFNRRMGAA